MATVISVSEFIQSIRAGQQKYANNLGAYVEWLDLLDWSKFPWLPDNYKDQIYSGVAIDKLDFSKVLPAGSVVFTKSIHTPDQSAEEQERLAQEVKRNIFSQETAEKAQLQSAPTDRVVSTASESIKSVAAPEPASSGIDLKVVGLIVLIIAAIVAFSRE